MSWLEEFVSRFYNPHASSADIHQAFAIKNANLPPMLYRYRSPEDYSIEELENDAVFMNPPVRHNDPLDSLCNISSSDVFTSIARKNLLNWIRRPGITNRLSDAQIQDCVQSDDPLAALHTAMIATEPPERLDELNRCLQALRQVSAQMQEESIQPIRPMLQERVLICCFAIDYDSAPMWHHYSVGHTGLCIAYNLAALPLDDIKRRWLYPVTYSENVFDLTPHWLAMLEGIRSVVWPMIVCTHKLAQWSYEKEWRIVMPPETTPGTPALYPLTKPSAVYLGARMAPDKQSRAVEIAHRRGIAVFKMEVSHQAGRMVARSVT